VKEYEGVCEAEGTSAFPPSYSAVCLYVSELVRKRKGSAKTLDAAVAAVKVAAGDRGCSWLSEHEVFKLGRLVKQYELEDPYQVNRKHGLQLKHLLPWTESKDLEDVFQLEEVTIIMLGHDGLLRTGELLRGLKVKDVIWSEDREYFSVWLERSKANRAGSGELVTIPRYGERCAVEYMKKWFDAMEFWEESKADSFLFPGRKRGGRSFEYGATISPSWLRSRIKKVAVYLGLDIADYSGHSLRAGGATDLFVKRVPYYLIKKMGRWKSDAALLYYRSDEDVYGAVQKAFEELAVLDGGEVKSEPEHYWKGCLFP
jgi:hypothetical protein